MLQEKRAYFEREAAVARATDDPRHVYPVFPVRARVLSVGCGGGWEGEDLGADRFVGVDIDPDAAEFRQERGARTEFHLTGGETLPFKNNEFTFCMARVSIMYMDVRKFFPEAYRVLAPGGTVWFTCHDFSHVFGHLRASVTAGRVKDMVFRSYVIANGLLYHALGTLAPFPVGDKLEWMQTDGGVRRGLQRAGFTNVQFPETRHGHFLVTAHKPR